MRDFSLFVANPLLIVYRGKCTFFCSSWFKKKKKKNCRISPTNKTKVLLCSFFLSMIPKVNINKIYRGKANKVSYMKNNVTFREVTGY